MTGRDRCRCCAILACATAVAACTPARDGGRDASARKRDIVITTVPLLSKELAKTYPFLTSDFAKGGVLEGKEVYAFMPSTVTVAEGDTLDLTFINPEDDPHSFVLTDLSVSIPGQSVTHASYVARHAGIFDFICDIPTHLPMMRGQLVVLRRERVTP
jgi:plastocyanin